MKVHLKTLEEINKSMKQFLGTITKRKQKFSTSEIGEVTNMSPECSNIREAKESIMSSAPPINLVTLMIWTSELEILVTLVFQIISAFICKAKKQLSLVTYFIRKSVLQHLTWVCKSIMCFLRIMYLIYTQGNYSHIHFPGTAL